jgi:hypothetical protein
VLRRFRTCRTEETRCHHSLPTQRVGNLDIHMWTVHSAQSDCAYEGRDARRRCCDQLYLSSHHQYSPGETLLSNADFYYYQADCTGQHSPIYFTFQSSRAFVPSEPLYHYPAYTNGQWMYQPSAQRIPAVPATTPISMGDQLCGMVHATDSRYLPYSCIHINDSKLTPDETGDNASSVSTGASMRQRIKMKGTQTNKRFVWTSSLHGLFVQAIFSTGLKRYVPRLSAVREMLADCRKCRKHC